MNQTLPETGFQQGSLPVSDLLGRVAACRLHLRRKYLGGGAEPAETFSVIASEYLAAAEWAKTSRLVCPEDYGPPITAAVMDTLCGLPSDFKITQSPVVGAHMAYQGSVSPLHFDWDMSEVLHLNLSGERTIWIGAPRAAPLLPVMGNSVLADFELFPDAKRQSLLEWFDMKPFKLSPGGFIRFPAHYWHLVDYETESLAVSVRREVSPELRPLQCLERSWYLQIWLNEILAKETAERTWLIADLITATDTPRGFDVSSERALTKMRETLTNKVFDASSAMPWKVGGNSKTIEPRSGTIISDEEAEAADLGRDWLFAAYESDIVTAETQRKLVRDYLFR